MQLNQTENKLKGLSQPQREWFQTMKQRRDEKERLSVTEPKEKKKGGGGSQKKSGGKNKDSNKNQRVERKTPSQLAKERAMRELEKVSLVRAKLAKSHSRAGKIRAIQEDSARPAKLAGNKKRSKFLSDLTDTSQKGARKLR